MKKFFVAAVALSCCVGGASAGKVKSGAHAPQTIKVKDVLAPAPYGSVRIGGFVGERMDRAIENRVMAQDIDLIVSPFRDRPDGNWGFRCEFWGKWYTSAMQAYGYAPTPEHRAVIDRAAEELIRTQTPDGYIGTYPDEHHLGDWDVWGRKYVLLGLIGNYTQTGDARVLEAARKVADHLILEAGPESGVNIAATGWNGWKGLAPSSVLEPIALLYQITGEKKYLDFAEHIVRCWDEPNRLSPTGIRLVQEALSGTPLWKMSGVPKAYEMMSCFEGLCELYRITGDRHYLEASRKLIDTIIRDEIMIVGSGSCAEIWCHGKMRQTEPMYQGMETCVTVTWMKYLYQMLRLTGDSRYGDQLEISLYNALLAAMTPQGDWWSYFTSLMGERTPSHQQFPDLMMSCCLANGPRGLLLTPSWAVMNSDKGVVLNMYAPITATQTLPSGAPVRVAMETEYPVHGAIAVTLDMERPERFSLDLRIPYWSENTTIRINGKEYDGYAVPGTYASVDREWSDGDRIEIVMDMRARVVAAPSGIGDAAVQRGPIVLAFDSRLVPFRTYVEQPPMYRYEFMNNTGEEYIDVELVDHPEHPDIWMVFNVPFRDEAGAKHYLPMCDFVSAGNTWQEGNLFRVWMQQPFDFRHLYVNKLNWRVNMPDGDQRPEIPAACKK